MAGLTVLGLASLVGGSLDSAGQLIAARAVMGTGAAMTFPATLSILTHVFTERKERVMASACGLRSPGSRSRSGRSSAGHSCRSRTGAASSSR